MSSRRILISYAHPDDETFGLGGLITKYVEAGVEIYLICATNGDAGSMDEHFLEGGKTIKQVRLDELDCAVKKLGIHEVFLLDYHDSGMMGSPDNERPDSLWYQWNHEPQSVTRRVVEVIRQVQPQVILTFNEYGGYGHPDHIAIQQATVQAMAHVNDPDYITDGLPPYQPQKLYYSSIPRLPIQIGIMTTRLQGKDPRRLGRNQDIDIVKILDNINEPTTVIDVRRYTKQWDDANLCHASQGGGRSGFGLPRWARRILFPSQQFTLIYPQTPLPVSRMERDLFENVTVDERREVARV